MLERNSSRAVILNSKNEVLLYKFIQDQIQGNVAWWVFPGGGVEGTETFEEALIREIEEEVGITIHVPMKWIWKRDILLDGKHGPLFSHERFYLIHLDIETIHLDQFTENEKKTFQQYHWFSLDELRSSNSYISVSQAYDLIQTIIQKKKNRISYCNWRIAIAKRKKCQLGTFHILNYSTPMMKEYTGCPPSFTSTSTSYFSSM